MTNENTPIVCTLNDAEFRVRERTVLDQLKARVIDATETTGGYSFRFPSDDDVFNALNEFIALERGCCSFLDFTMTVPRGKADITLELSGPGGAKDFIATTFLP